MNRTTRFMVEIITEDKIDDDNVKNEISQNIADAIAHACNTCGIIPDEVDTFTNVIYVKEWYSDKQIIVHP